MTASRIGATSAPGLPASTSAGTSVTIPTTAGPPDRGGRAVLTRIDHVGIACRDLAERISFYDSAFGLTVVSQQVNEAHGVREAMLHVADGPAGSSYVQLLEPLGADTPVGRFIARRGEGLPHVGYGVADVSAAPPTPRAGGCPLSD